MLRETGVRLLKPPDVMLGELTSTDILPMPDKSDLAELLAASAQLRDMCDKLAINADFANRGRKLTEHGLLLLGPFKGVPAKGFHDWQTDPLRNRSWQWRLNWLSFTSYLIAHHCASGDPRAIEIASEAALSWLEHFGSPTQRHPFEFAWHDHGTALRAEQIALLVYYVQTRSLQHLLKADGALDRLCAACVEHSALLYEDGFFSRHTNHGLEQARVLLLLGTALGNDADERPTAWRSRALERLEAELHHAFTEEGVHVENSPAYHVFVLKVFVRTLSEYPADSLGPLRTWMQETAPKALDFLARIIRPDRLLPILGDTEALPISDSFRPIFEGQRAYEELVYVQSGGRRGMRPSSLNRVYPASGYAIFRSEWPDRDQFDSALHVVFKAGALSNYHLQHDDGNVLVYFQGEDWLIDSGMFNYEKGSHIRRYVRSRAAHNVVAIDRPTSEKAEPGTKWRVLAYSEDDGQPFVTALSTFYPGLTAIRRLSLSRRRNIRVEDTLVTTNGSPFDASVLWHIPADKEVEIHGGSEILVKSKTSRRAMRIRIQGDLPDTVECRSGVSGKIVSSVVSKMANQYDDSQVLIFSAVQRTSVYMQFEFSFEVQP